MRDWRTTTTVAIDVMVYAILSVVSLLSFHPSADGKPRGSQPASSLPPHSTVLLLIPLQKEKEEFPVHQHPRGIPPGQHIASLCPPPTAQGWEQPRAAAAAQFSLLHYIKQSLSRASRFLPSRVCSLSARIRHEERKQCEDASPLGWNRKLEHSLAVGAGLTRDNNYSTNCCSLKKVGWAHFLLIHLTQGIILARVSFLMSSLETKASRCTVCL